jgi:hypothetical protein
MALVSGERQPAAGPGASQWLFSALLFCFGMAAVWLSGWELRDVVWGFWITSLAIGYLLILAGIGHIGLHQLRNRGKRLRAVVAYMLFMVAFFTFHFGFFHWGQAHFLAAFLDWPELTAVDFPAIFLLLPTLVADYWPIILAGLAFRVGDARALMGEKLGAATNARETERALNELIAFPYSGVLRLHIAIFGLLAARMFSLPDPLLFTLAYAWFFLPFDFTPGRARKRKAGRGA